MTLPSPELPGLGETLPNNGGAGAASPWLEAAGHLGLGGFPCTQEAARARAFPVIVLSLTEQ